MLIGTPDSRARTVGGRDYPDLRAGSRRPIARRRGRFPVEPGVYRFPRRARPGDLRRQGQEPAPAAELLLRRSVRAAPAHPSDGHQRGRGGMDHRQHRGRGAAAGIQLDQGVRPALQRSLPRRQVLPVAGGHALRAVPAGCRSCADPRRSGVRYFGPYAHAWAIRETLDLLLRVFPARTCSAGVFKRAQPGWSALPARLHRQVQRAVRRPGQRRGTPRDRR